MNTTDEGFSLSSHKNYKLVPTYPRHALLLAPFFARSLTLVPRSLLLNRTETLATQAILAADVYQNRVSSFKNLEGGKQAKT